MTNTTMSSATATLAARDVFRRRARPAQDAILVSKRVFRKQNG